MSTPPLFYLSRDAEIVTGPHAAGYLRQGLEAGKLTLDTLTCLDGTQDWLPMREFAVEIGLPRPQPEHITQSKRKGPRLPAVLILFVAGVAAFAFTHESKKTQSRRAAAENLERLRRNAELSRIAAEIEGKVQDYMKSDPHGIKESRKKWRRDEAARKKDEAARQFDRGKINFAEKEMLLKAIDDDEERKEKEEERETLEAAEEYRARLEKEAQEKREARAEWNKEHPDFTVPNP